MSTWCSTLASDMAPVMLSLSDGFRLRDDSWHNWHGSLMLCLIHSGTHLVDVVPALQDFVDLERLPFNRDYKGILGNIMAIRKMKRPRYKTRLNPDIGGSAQKYSMVPGRSSADSRGFLWTSEVGLLEQHHLSLALVAGNGRRVLPHVC